MSLSRTLRRRRYAEARKLTQDEIEEFINYPELKKLEPFERRVLASLVRIKDAAHKK